MNILILSIGRKCWLVDYFRRSENEFDKVITADCSNYAPALYISDKHYVVPRMTDSAYLPAIKDICKNEAIHVILPLQEDELELMAVHRNEFHALGIFVVISDFNTIKLCRDKYLFYKWLKEKDIPVVKTYDYEHDIEEINSMNFPIFVKERTGAGSVGNLTISNRALLSAYADNSEKKLVVQPYYDDMEEYGIDTYIDFISGEIVAIFAKEKIEMRAGETEKSRSVIDEKLFELVRSVAKEIQLRGPFDMDVFKYKEEYYVLEINPRFGGGYSHAYECGVNFMKYISMNAKGMVNDPEIGEYPQNQVLLKYTDVMLKNEEDMF